MDSWIQRSEKKEWMKKEKEEWMKKEKEEWMKNEYGNGDY